MLQIFITMGFYPILDTFISMMDCKTINATSYHYYFTTIECWKNEKIFHNIMAIIIGIIFTLLSLTISICYYECKSTSNVPTARSNSRAHCLTLFYMAVMIVSFTFMSGDDYHYILLIFILGGSLMLFFKFHFNSPYYNEIMAKTMSCLMSIN